MAMLNNKKNMGGTTWTGDVADLQLDFTLDPGSPNLGHAQDWHLSAKIY